jgi:hypothetical protein
MIQPSPKKKPLLKAPNCDEEKTQCAETSVNQT